MHLSLLSMRATAAAAYRETPSLTHTNTHSMYGCCREREAGIDRRRERASARHDSTLVVGCRRPCAAPPAVAAAAAGTRSPASLSLSLFRRHPCCSLALSFAQPSLSGFAFALPLLASRRRTRRRLVAGSSFSPSLSLFPFASLVSDLCTVLDAVCVRKYVRRLTLTLAFLSHHHSASVYTGTDRQTHSHVCCWRKERERRGTHTHWLCLRNKT